MKSKKRRENPKPKKTVSVTVGIDLDITGRSLAAEAAKRIAWHKQMATDKAAALERLPAGEVNHLGLPADWKRDERRRQLAESVSAHQEHARFLEFVRVNLKQRRIYRPSLQDLSYLEITPKDDRYI
ncbi:MAG TPA: hypothetical protein VL326_03455 [Kofleriaceae bacterium]|nr:hypothetical protein [Kofleriaceae bacterium]